MEIKKEYIAPELTVVSFKTERGYAASNNPLAAFKLLTSLVGMNSGNMEEWDFDQNDDTFGDDAISWS